MKAEMYVSSEDAGFEPLREKLEQVLRNAMNRLAEIEPFASEPPARFKMAMVASFTNILAGITMMLGEGAGDIELVTGANADEVVRKFRQAIQAELMEELSNRSGIPDPLSLTRN